MLRLAQYRQKGLTVALQFGVPDTGDAQQRGVTGWSLLQHRTQRRVVEDHVRRDVVFFGKTFAAGAQRVP